LVDLVALKIDNELDKLTGYLPIAPIKHGNRSITVELRRVSVYADKIELLL